MMSPRIAAVLLLAELLYAQLTTFCCKQLQTPASGVGGSVVDPRKSAALSAGHVACVLDPAAD